MLFLNAVFALLKTNSFAQMLDQNFYLLKNIRHTVEGAFNSACSYTIIVTNNFIIQRKILFN